MHHWCAPDLKYIRQVRALQFDSSWRKGRGERERKKGKQGKKENREKRKTGKKGQEKEKR
jgi:hypothetical protein